MGLFLPRQAILAPVGLVTQPNQYAQYPSGACKVAQNVTLRNPGELVQAPDVQATLTLGNIGDIIHKLIPMASAFGGFVYSVVRNGTSWSLYANNTLCALVGSATNAFAADGFISSAQVSDRLVLNGAFGCLVVDPPPASSTVFRESGLTQPTISFISAVDGGSGWFNGGSMVSYTACFVRRFSDDYTVRSTPSAPVKFFFDSSITTPYNLTVTIDWASSLIILPGDIVELYRTDILQTTNPYADPGATFKLVQEYTLTNGDAGATIVSLKDAQPPIYGSYKTAGRELYTNPGQDGEEYANKRPPIAKCIESFKGFAFYGNTTEPAQLVFSVPGGLGDVSEAAAAGMAVTTFREKGIGIRRGSGTITNGSPTITGISAAEIVGLKIGQAWVNGTGFPGPFNRITAVGATTVTLNVNANANAGTWQFEDVLEINGVSYAIDSGIGLSNSLGGLMDIECDQALPFTNPRFMLSFEFTLSVNKHPMNASFTVRATNGANYSPPVPEYTATVKTLTPIVKKNRIQWSKEQQPEHCPSVSEDFVGFGDVLAFNATRDAMWIWCSDGLFRLSGNAGALGLGAWQVDYANSTVLLAAPQASTVLNEFLYAYTNDGFVEIDSAGVPRNITDKVIGDLLPGTRFVADPDIIVERNETDAEILLTIGDAATGSNTVYVFNAVQRGWTTLGNNGLLLSAITAMAMQRHPSSGGARPLIGVYRGAFSQAPAHSGWNNPAAFLTAEIRYQPIYGDDPLELKRWLWGDYLFDSGSNGRTFVPTWNGTQFGGTVTVEAFDQGGYARAGVPREVGSSHSISPGLRAISSGATPVRFQGLSVPVKQRTNQGKKR